MLKAISAALAVGFTLFLAPVASAEEDGPAKVAKTDKGEAYTDAKGMTLYVFDKDAKDKSNCAADCAANWPPFKVAADAKASGEWSIVARDDGAKQWAYDGKPLYTFIKDKKPGDAAGEGMGGVWHIAKP